MPLDEKQYNVLLVSASQAVTEAVREQLRSSSYSQVRTVADISSAKRAVADLAYDIVIVNSPLPDDPGIRFAIDTGSVGASVVLLLVRSELFEEITDRVRAHGVFTLAKPAPRNMFRMALSWLFTARQRLSATEKKTLTLEEKMAEIRLVNRAKWQLIEREGMDEPTAHRYIEKQAMDRCVTRRVIAEEILKSV